MKKIIAITLFAIATLSFSASALAFSDISGNAYEQEIQYLSDNGLVKGYDDGTFKPDAFINRAEFLKIIIGTSVKNIDTSSYVSCFKDVKDEWYANYICFAKDKGIVKGYEDGYFRPINNISFAEAAKIIISATGSKITAPADVEWYVPYMEKLNYYDAIPGTLRWKPAATTNVTRGEMSYIIAVLLKSRNTDIKTQITSDTLLSTTGNIYGNAKAEITIVTFTDFECPFCAKFHPVLKKIVDESNGTVNFEYKNFPLDIHDNALFEAAAGECVAKLNDNNTYWLFIDKLFSASFADADSIVKTINALGVNVPDFNACIEEAAPAALVEKDNNLGMAIGVMGTPTSIIIKNATGDYEVLEGNQPESVVKGIITGVKSK